MKRLLFYVIVAWLCISLGLLLSCSSSSGGGASRGGDDAFGDDDDVPIDDDVTDDDDASGDDDSSGGGDDDSGGGSDDDNGSNDDDAADDDTGTGDTWTDSSSGLTWQVTPGGWMIWVDAKSYCDNLTLAGGGWHLPTISELRTLIRGCDGTVTGGSCGVTDSCLDSSCQDESCYSCEYGFGPNNGCYGPSELPLECYGFWSSSPVADLVNGAWAVGFNGGYVSYGDTIGNVYNAYARCVRP